MALPTSYPIPLVRRLGTRPAAREALAVGGIVLLAAVVRFSTLGARSYWVDEAVTVQIMRSSVLDAIRRIPQWESAPPLYYALAWPWAQVFGTGETGLRSLSALLGVATVPVAWALGRELLGARAGLVLALLVATNPMLVWYSQETRAYALYALLGAASFLFFVRVLDDRGRRSLLLWAATSALAVWTHYFAAFFVSVEACVLLVRRPTRAVLLAVGGVAAAALALAPLVYAQGAGKTSWIGDLPLVNRIGGVARQFVSGVNNEAYALGGIAFALLVVGVFLLARFADAAARARVALAGGVAGVGLALALAVDLAGGHFFLDRNVLGALIPLLAVAAGGFAAGRAGLVGVGAAAALAAVWLAVDISVASEPKHGQDVRALTRALAPATRARAIVGSPQHAVAIPANIYLGADRLADGDPVTVDEIVVAATGVGRGERRLRPRAYYEAAYPGFAVIEAREEPSFTFVRLRAARPVRLRAAALERAAFLPNDADVALQPARRDG